MNNRSQDFQTIWYNPLPRRSARLSGGNKGGASGSAKLAPDSSCWVRSSKGTSFETAVCVESRHLLSVTPRHSMVGLNRKHATSRALVLNKHAMTLAWAWWATAWNDACVTRTHEHTNAHAHTHARTHESTRTRARAHNAHTHAWKHARTRTRNTQTHTKFFKNGM